MLRFLPVGPRTLLAELDDLDATLALFDALTADPVDGVIEIVPGARTLMIRTAPGVAADARLAAAITAHQPPPGAAARGPETAEIVEVPVLYDGPDLEDVARHMQLNVAEVIEAHQAATWQVAFCGFAPGFAYMTCHDPRFDLPRRPSPRTRIPAGSVALAGRFCGVYPQATPGGWQLIGTTPIPMWDLTRDPPALLRPGVRACFVTRQGAPRRPAAPPAHRGEAALTVVATAFPILFQDEGRAGQGGQGVSASGALDIGSLRRANRAVGNPSGTPALEITLGPVRLRASQAVTLALAGAAETAEIGRGDRRTPVASGAAFALDAGDELLIPPPPRGMRTYLAARGGFDVAPVLGSAATDTLAHVGPPALSDGAPLALARHPAGAVTPDAGLAPQLPASGDTVELPVVLGPRTDWFPPETVERFLSQEWTVTPQSSRVGIRLHGAAPLTRSDTTELASEGTENGAVQVPHSGQPVLFLADHPLTGGYPVIATLLPSALDLAGQIPPGVRIRFAAAQPFAPITPSEPQE